jgi:hypothetical protein
MVIDTNMKQLEYSQKWRSNHYQWGKAYQVQKHNVPCDYSIRRDLQDWPSRSLNITPCNFYLWEYKHIKCKSTTFFVIILLDGTCKTGHLDPWTLLHATSTYGNMRKTVPLRMNFKTRAKINEIHLVRIRRAHGCLQRN